MQVSKEQFESWVAEAIDSVPEKSLNGKTRKQGERLIKPTL
jgi:hypothetical protein